MSFLVHLLLTALIVYCLVSYLACGYVAFFPKDPALKEASIFGRIFFWMLSPLIMLDVIYERVFGKGLI